MVRHDDELEEVEVDANTTLEMEMLSCNESLSLHEGVERTSYEVDLLFDHDEDHELPTSEAYNVDLLDEDVKLFGSTAAPYSIGASVVSTIPRSNCSIYLLLTQSSDPG